MRPPTEEELDYLEDVLSNLEGEEVRIERFFLNHYWHIDCYGEDQGSFLRKLQYNQEEDTYELLHY